MSDLLLGIIGGLIVGLLVWVAGSLNDISSTLKDLRKEKLR